MRPACEAHGNHRHPAQKLIPFPRLERKRRENLVLADDDFGLKSPGSGKRGIESYSMLRLDPEISEKSRKVVGQEGVPSDTEGAQTGVWINHD